MNKQGFKKSVKIRKQRRKLELVKYLETFIDKIVKPKLEYNA